MDTQRRGGFRGGARGGRNGSHGRSGGFDRGDRMNRGRGGRGNDGRRRNDHFGDNDSHEHKPNHVGGSGVVRSNIGNGGRGRSGSGAKSSGGRGSQTPLNLDEAFCMHIHTTLQALIDDATRQEMSFPKNLDNHQRRYIHSMAEKYGLFSKSSGKNENRFIHVAKVKKNANMEQISLRLPSIKLNGNTLAWFPQTIREYLHQYEPVPDLTLDPWTAGSLTPSWNSHCVSDSSRRTGHSVFKPLRPSRNFTQAPLRDNKGNLPVHCYRRRILEYVDNHQVVVISGDTGCGKSTQIPQFLLDDMIRQGRSSETRIICSQPRRLSAISLAERVAIERQASGGDPKDVGHAIRFDSAFDVHRTKLIFCTTGTLLKWLNTDPLAHGFSHLILDEVHERDQFTDFLLILLKSNILKKRPDLKIILMSATIQVEKFAQYFAPEWNVPVLEMVGGRCFPVMTLFLDDILGLIHHANTHGGAQQLLQQAHTITQDDDVPCIQKGFTCPMCQTSGWYDEQSYGIHLATCFGEPSVDMPTPAKAQSKSERKADVANSNTQSDVGESIKRALQLIPEAVKTSLLENYVRQEDALSRDQSVDTSLLLQLLMMIEDLFPMRRSVENQGAILVFLPGWEEISSVERELLHHHETASIYEISLLHSRLSAQEQRKAFLKPPRGKRKLILATNIAETSLTIEDVVYVIDCGKSKQAHALATTSSSSFVMGLQTTWVSKANSIQRMGRAGRVRPGICFRLFSQARYENSMKEFMTPELLTTPLEELLLHIKLLQFEKKLPIEDAKTFLMQAMDSPSENSIDASLDRLESMNALDSHKSLTLLGWHLAHITDNGVSVHMGKLLLWSHVFGAFTSIVQTTCALSGYRDPFLSFLGMSPQETRQVEASKLAFMNTAKTSVPFQSDHFVLLQAMGGYLQFPPRAFHDMENYCRRNMLHRPTMEQITSIYHQLERDLGLLGMSNISQLVTTLHESESPTVQDHRFHTSAPSRTTKGHLAPYIMSLCAGLYPNVLFTKSNTASRNWTSKEKVKVRLDGSSLLSKGPSKDVGRNKDEDNEETLEWLLYHEMMQSERTRVAKTATKLPSVLPLLLLVGSNELLKVEEIILPDSQGEETVSKWIFIVDEWIVFELDSMEEVQAILTLRTRLQSAFSRHLDRLHAAHIHQSSALQLQLNFEQQQLHSHQRHATHVASPPINSPLPNDQWYKHDQMLVTAIINWIAKDLEFP